MKVLQINSIVNSGSTGRIAEDLGDVLLKSHHESYIAYGRNKRKSSSQTIRIGTEFDIVIHGLISRVFDRHGFASITATKKLTRQIETISPDIIHIHCLHGYYINVKILFQYLERSIVPVVWTFHDAWAFTGHCTYFDQVNCYKWETQCNKCPNLKAYPSSFFIDNSKSNFIEKKDLFNKVDKMVIVSPSEWLANFSKISFLKKYPIRVIYNGVDLNVFRIYDTHNLSLKYNTGTNKIILGVASIWGQRKGLDDFIKLSEMLGTGCTIILVGLSKSQQNQLSVGMIGLDRTESVEELAKLYSFADVFVNPTWVDNFPTTNLEALACGTPVITYNTGGSPESIDEQTGIVVPKGDLIKLKNAVLEILSKPKSTFRHLCRERAIKYFNKNDRYEDYISLYKELLNNNK
jgi:glycosyltransferase involved in cell wall biosynthesis